MTVISVQSAKLFADAVSIARSGDTIQLAGGDYGDVSLVKKLFAGAGVTITSADASNSRDIQHHRHQREFGHPFRWREC